MSTEATNLQRVTHLQWRAGEGGEQPALTFPRDQAQRWGWVRVLAEPGICTVRLRTASGPELGPIDAPCLVPVELPLAVLVTRALIAASPVLAVVTWGEGAPPAVLPSPHRLPLVAGGVALPLGPWETSVDVVNLAAVADWLDAAGVVLGTVAGDGNPRPPLAVSIRPDLPTYLRIQ